MAQMAIMACMTISTEHAKDDNVAFLLLPVASPRFMGHWKNESARVNAFGGTKPRPGGLRG